MAEKRTIELEIQDNSKSLKQQYREAVKELQNVAAAYGETSAEAVKAAQKAANLKDQIGFTNDLVGAFNPDAKFNALSKSIGGVLDGFQAVQGGLGLIGIEGEAVEEAMVRVQSAMALSQGLQGLMEAKDSFKQLGTVAANALKGIRTGLAATGIGLFVIALGTIVAYWDDIKAAVSGVSEEQANLNKLSHDNFETSKEQLSNLDAQDNILKLQGKSEREILNLKIAKVNTAIELGKIELQNVILTSKAEEEAAIKNYNLTKQIVDFILDTALFLPKLMLMPIDMAIAGANKVSEALGFGKVIAFDMGKTMDNMQNKFSGFIAGSIFNVPEVQAEGEKTRKELEKQLKDLENQKAGFQLQVEAIDKQGVQTAIDAKKEEQDKKLQAEKEYNEKLRAYYDAIEQERQGQIEDAKEKELQALDNKFEALYKAADDANQSDKELLLKHQQEIGDINTKYDLLAKEEAKKTADELAKIEKDKLDEIEKANKAAAEQKAALQQQGLDTALQGVQLIAGIFSKQKGVQKAALIAESAIGIAKMIISNKLANAGALATPQAIATSGAAAAPVIAMNNISTGIGIAANIAATAKALKELGGGSVPAPAPLGGGGGVGGGAQMAAPQFNTIGTSGINQLATLQQQPTKAYVVSGEVTSAQSLDRNRLQNATL